MTYALVFLVGVLIFAWTIWLLDWLGRRRDRKAGRGNA
jgi:hypothetical protein